jgi:hypothetical protein
MTVTLDGHTQTLLVNHEFGGRMSRYLMDLHALMLENPPTNPDLAPTVDRIRSTIDAHLLATDGPALIAFRSHADWVIVSDVASGLMEGAA